MLFRRSQSSGVPLLEILIVLGLLCGLGFFVSTSMRKARQRAVLGVLEPLGVKGIFDDSGWMTGIDATGIPDDQFRLDEFRGLKDVPALNLDHTEVSDETLPDLTPSLGLKTLTLTGTAVSDAGCDALAQHPELRLLDLRLTFVSDKGLQKLTALKQLRELRLAQTRVTDVGLDFIKSFPRLRKLDLRDTFVTDKGIQKLVASTSLQEVLLKNSDVTQRGIDELTSDRPDLIVEFSPAVDDSVRVRLREPHVVAGNAKDFHPLAERESYACFFGRMLTCELKNGWINTVGTRTGLKGDDATEFLAGLATFRELEVVDLSRNEFTDQDLALLLQNRGIRQLSVSHTKVTDEGLLTAIRLPRLTHLWLAGLPISDEGYLSLRRAKQLVWLGLSGSSVTPSAIRQLKSVELLNLELRDSAVDEKMLKAISELHTLEHLDISKNTFLDHGLEHLAKLKHLRYLNLARTAVTDDDVQQLLNFSDSLKDVILTRSRVSKEAAAKLQNCGRDWTVTF